MTDFACITEHGLRRQDRWGSGHFGASRGSRRHSGLDLVASPGEQILSPIDGTITRIAYPYSGTLEYQGAVIVDASGLEVRIYYVAGVELGAVKAGDVIGTAQNLRRRYPDITNHVHVEIRVSGAKVDPTPYFSNCQL
ncbi:MAG: M23 family metallopeptidase [Deltaproteobacteria bacterium]|nr:M23 family metallopeptidase [Deltaproteobacteria bacterium]